LQRQVAASAHQKRGQVRTSRLAFSGAMTRVGRLRGVPNGDNRRCIERRPRRGNQEALNMKIGSRYVGFRRNKLGRLVLRIAKDERGAQMVEIALGIALMAAIAGFGLLILGSNLGTFFQATGSKIGPAAVPNQSSGGAPLPTNMPAP